MFKRFALIIFVFYCYPAFAFEKSDIQYILDQSRVKYSLPAISVSIQLPEGNITNYVSGYYSLSNHKKITPDTLFQIGSITKTFTATIVFKLIEENKLNSQDKLSKWLPQYPRWKNITIDNLLHHTSGTYNYISNTEFDNLLRKNPTKYWSLKELADKAYQHTDLSKPGKKYNYTNTDYILLGMVIEKATNKTIQLIFDDYLKEYDLKNTFYSPEKYSNAIKNKIAHGYNRDGTFKFDTDVTFASTSFSQSAGALISTPSDIIKWLQNLFTGKIITFESLADMTQVISEKNAKSINIHNFHPVKSQLFTEVGAGAGIGLIYFKSNGFNWVHSGGMPGYESFYAYNPCTGTYLALAYSAKPKQQLIFIQIAEEIFKKLNNSNKVIEAIHTYQSKNKLPDYCNNSY